MQRSSRKRLEKFRDRKMYGPRLTCDESENDDVNASTENWSTRSKSFARKSVRDTFVSIFYNKTNVTLLAETVINLRDRKAYGQRLTFD